MPDIQIAATFAPNKQDRSALSTVSRRTLATFFRHPIAHNLDRNDVLALFAKIGTVQRGANSAVTYAVGDAHLHIAKTRGHSLLVDEVMGLRHLLSRTGWGPETEAAIVPGHATPGPLTPDLLVIVEEGTARLLTLEPNATSAEGHAVTAPDPRRLLRHLSHHDQGRDEEQRAREESEFHTIVAEALGETQGHIVLAGHGAGHSNAAHRLAEDLRHRYPQVAGRVVRTIAADISALTENQLRALGRKALTA